MNSFVDKLTLGDCPPILQALVPLTRRNTELTGQPLLDELGILLDGYRNSGKIIVDNMSCLADATSLRAAETAWGSLNVCGDNHESVASISNPGQALVNAVTQDSCPAPPLTVYAFAEIADALSQVMAGRTQMFDPAAIIEALQRERIDLEGWEVKLTTGAEQLIEQLSTRSATPTLIGDSGAVPFAHSKPRINQGQSPPVVISLGQSGQILDISQSVPSYNAEEIQIGTQALSEREKLVLGVFEEFNTNLDAAQQLSSQLRRVGNSRGGLHFYMCGYDGLGSEAEALAKEFGLNGDVSALKQKVADLARKALRNANNPLLDREQQKGLQTALLATLWSYAGFWTHQNAELLNVLKPLAASLKRKK